VTRPGLALAMRLALAMYCVVVAGCGSEQPRPKVAPRATVLRFIDDLQARRMQEACAVLDPAEARNIRQNVIGDVRVPPGTPAERLRFIQRINAASKRCPVALGLLADQLDKQLPRIRSAAAAATLSKPFPADLWMLGNQDWVVEPRNGRLIIIGTDALTVAQESLQP
jgi:hypothetical protein